VTATPSQGRRRPRPVPPGRLLLLGLLALGLLWPPLPTAAADGEEVSTYRINIRRLQEGILKQEDQLSATRDQERSILSELETLDQRLSQQQAKLLDLEEKVRQQQRRIEVEEENLNRVRGEREQVQKHLQKRITAYYTMGKSGLLNVTFSTRTFPELLAFNDAFDSLIQYDEGVIRDFRQAIQELERVRNALALQQTVLEDFLAQAVAEKEALEEIRQEKATLLAQVRTQSKLHQQAAVEMEQAAEELAKTIVAIKGDGGDAKGFEAEKGRLPPPVDGVLLTLYQQERADKLGIAKKSAGIELRAAEGTRVVAVSDGEVVFSGYLRGYGNAVIIHHGLQYYTITARLEKIQVSKGDKVKREQPLGTIGVTARLFDDGLYFEIRHGRQSLDPLLWLNPNRLQSPDEGKSPRQ
jgi:murein hydrolase activator